jgi:hypothetical protein
VKRKVGCGLWLVWLLLAVFAGEWIVLWLAFKVVPREQLPLYVFGAIVATIIGGWVAVYLRIQRRP